MLEQTQLQLESHARVLIYTLHFLLQLANWRLVFSVAIFSILCVLGNWWSCPMQFDPALHLRIFLSTEPSKILDSKLSQLKMYFIQEFFLFLNCFSRHGDSPILHSSENFFVTDCPGDLQYSSVTFRVLSVTPLSTLHTCLHQFFSKLQLLFCILVF